MAENWDNLIILDACRADYFRNLNHIEGDLATVRSRGSTSKEWIRGNFSGGYPDTVLLTANPWYQELSGELGLMFHDYRFVEPSSDQSYTRPERMFNVVREYADRYDNKRIIAHFMQPHHPYLKHDGSSILSGTTQLHIQKIKSGLSNDEVRRAYAECLEIVLRWVDELIDHLAGKTVVSADHGELLGEQLFNIPYIDGYWGHRYGVNHDYLRMVPWLEVEGQERKQVTTENSEEIVPSERVKRRLSQLGYRED